MQNCPLKSTQIAYVMALNALNHKTYSALHTPPGTFAESPGSTTARMLILCMSTFVTKLNLYPQNSHC